MHLGVAGTPEAREADEQMTSFEPEGTQTYDQSRSGHARALQAPHLQAQCPQCLVCFKSCFDCGSQLLRGL